jgi:hypothetical protein
MFRVRNYGGNSPYMVLHGGLSQWQILIANRCILMQRWAGSRLKDWNSNVGELLTKYDGHCTQKERPPTRAVSPKFDQVFGLGYECSSLPLPAPAEQPQRAEAGREERERGGEWCRP